ncbi:hypothetical protein SAMN02745118_00223 [Selenihalanaerobacter shriftii]|uniref:Uncharacterized protein n=1 Tax=Selenihalanaerobacter shriftii TaxID=142842 RepID=A0A1T4JMP7_9FIRM|nr:hypothetical protein SAMN02745118_00223 [Selenihalanaerobacter shriftii]
MDLVEVSKLESGMVLAENIYSPNGEILLKKGIQIRDSYI